MISRCKSQWRIRGRSPSMRWKFQRIHELTELGLSSKSGWLTELGWFLKMRLDQWLSVGLALAMGMTFERWLNVAHLSLVVELIGVAFQLWVAPWGFLLMTPTVHPSLAPSVVVGMYDMQTQSHNRRFRLCFRRIRKIGERLHSLSGEKERLLPQKWATTGRANFSFFFPFLDWRGDTSKNERMKEAKWLEKVLS